MELAQQRPDLIDAGWSSACCPWRPKPSWNPESLEDRVAMGFGFGPKFNGSISTALSAEVGYLGSYLPLQLEHNVDYFSRRYKYIVVLAGLDGQATSGRLSAVLAHSGAVTLLQTTDYEYHFSARLKPWVHFVPISYSAADIIEKVEWLQQHEHMAFRIAQNARNFGLSYLRIEDYLCYIATLLKQLGDLYSDKSDSTALIPFDAKLIEGIPGKLDTQ